MAPAKPADRERCLVGIVRGARGLKGEVRIESFTADPADVAAYGPATDESGGRAFRLRVTGRTGKVLVFARIDGVDDRTAAEALKGTRLYVPRSALPPAKAGEYYLSDLIGLRAERPDGTALGTVAAVEDYGAGPILDVGGGPAGAFMVPFTDAVVPVVDVAGGRIVIDPPVGLFEAPAADAPRDRDEG